MNVFRKPPSSAVSNSSVPPLSRGSVSTNESATEALMTPNSGAVMNPTPRAVMTSNPDINPMETPAPLPATHTFSRTWTSFEKAEREKWKHTTQALISFGISPIQTARCLPWEWNEWCFHRLAVAMFDAQQIKRQISKKIDRMDKERTVVLAFAGKELSEGRSSVLAAETIWCTKFREVYGAMVWPTRAELKYEGEDRIAPGSPEDRSRYGRQLPLVRDWDPNLDPHTYMVDRSKVPRIQPFHFDDMQRIPNHEDIYCEVAQIPADEEENYLNKEIRAAFNEDEFSAPPTERPATRIRG